MGGQLVCRYALGRAQTLTARDIGQLSMAGGFPLMDVDEMLANEREVGGCTAVPVHPQLGSYSC
jgi:hypothetical protein